MGRLLSLATKGPCGAPAAGATETAPFARIGAGLLPAPSLLRSYLHTPSCTALCLRPASCTATCTRHPYTAHSLGLCSQLVRPSTAPSWCGPPSGIVSSPTMLPTCLPSSQEPRVVLPKFALPLPTSCLRTSAVHFHQVLFYQAPSSTS
jgi:hypothetical protein